jgi:hypothetical protein
MIVTTHSARITGPVPYLASGGLKNHIPLGPCLVEQVDGHLVDIIWGTSGQLSAALPLDEVKAAEEQGHLVLLD